MFLCCCLEVEEKNYLFSMILPRHGNQFLSSSLQSCLHERRRKRARLKSSLTDCALKTPTLLHSPYPQPTSDSNRELINTSNPTLFITTKAFVFKLAWKPYSEETSKLNLNDRRFSNFNFEYLSIRAVSPTNSNQTIFNTDLILHYTYLEINPLCYA